MQYGGVIYDQAGNYLPGVKIQAYDPLTGLPFGQPTHTGAQGSWVMDLNSGKFLLYFYAPGFLSYGMRVDQASELTMKPGEGYDPQPGELYPAIKSNRPEMDWKFLLLLGLAVYGLTR